MNRLLAAVLLAFAAAAPAVAATADHPKLVVDTFDGGKFDLAQQKGKWVIVNFWATWCSPCLKELPDISAFVAEHKDKVVAIGLDFEEAEKDDITKFLKTHPIGYPIAMIGIDNPPQDFDTPKGLPNTYVIDPEGKVAKAFLGPITAKDLAAAIGG